MEVLVGSTWKQIVTLVVAFAGGCAGEGISWSQDVAVGDTDVTDSRASGSNDSGAVVPWVSAADAVESKHDMVVPEVAVFVDSVTSDVGNRSDVAADVKPIDIFGVTVDTWSGINCASLNCDDGDPCTTDKCDAKNGCTHVTATANKVPCDDNNACTEKDHCYDGKCVGIPIVCGDGNACTTEVCDPKTGCSSDKNGLCVDCPPVGQPWSQKNDFPDSTGVVCDKGVGLEFYLRQRMMDLEGVIFFDGSWAKLKTGSGFTIHLKDESNDGTIVIYEVTWSGEQPPCCCMADSEFVTTFINKVTDPATPGQLFAECSGPAPTSAQGKP